ncbi:MAG: GGDEF domain-containing protein [Lachnospiraceae bacterium]|nr:GGDEF domain-containing protein [Lachnospiraceae bacterium]
MKKKIAVIANGWYNQGVKNIVAGMQRYTDEKGIDIFIFLTYSQYKETDEYNRGEFNIHRLPDFKDFDGVIIVPGSLNSEHETERMRKEFLEKGIPAVSMGVKQEGLGFISCENYESMCILSEHIINEHDIKNVAIIAGNKENEESNRRVEGITDTFEKHGMIIHDRDIYYCNWEFRQVKKTVKMMASSKRGLPDVIMCANDYGAMAVCTALTEAGYSVPGDVMVTGYDCVALGRAYYPSITTMAQPFEDMGCGAVEMLYDMIEDGEIREKNYICKLVLGESCGCDVGEGADKARKELARESFIKTEENVIFEWSLSNIENAFFRTQKFEDLAGVLRTQFERNHDYEKDGFAIVLGRRYRQSILTGKDELNKTGYDDDMEVIVGVHNEISYNLDHFDPKEIVPMYENDGDSHIYIISSLHNKENIFGYILFKDAMDNMADRTLYAYMTRMGELLEKYRKTMSLNLVNAELLELSVKDSLSGLYNRLGYEGIIKPAFEEVHSMGRKNGILFMDIDHMKDINDTFGHLQGDMAVRTIASVIQECLPAGWMAARYGGDEFVAIGACEDAQMLKYLSERMKSTVSKRGDELRLPYRLTASSGYLLTDPMGEENIEQYIKRVDEYMYINKKAGRQE